MSDSDSGLDAFLDKKAKKKEKTKKKAKKSEKVVKKEPVVEEDDDLAVLDTILPAIAEKIEPKPEEAEEKDEPLPWFRQVEKADDKKEEEEKKEEEKKSHLWVPGSSRKRLAKSEKFDVNATEWATLEDAKKAAQKTPEERAAETAKREQEARELSGKNEPRSSNTWRPAGGTRSDSSRGDVFDPKAAEKTYGAKWKAAKENEKQSSGGNWRMNEPRSQGAAAEAAPRAAFGERTGGGGGYVPPSARGESMPTAPRQPPAAAAPAAAAAAPAPGGYIPPSQRSGDYVMPARPSRKELAVEEPKPKVEAE
eukprot:gene10114-15548_t